MKEHVEYVVDNFVDFEGFTHHFVIAAVSVVDFCQHEDLGEYYGLEAANYYEYDSDSIASIVKGLKIGIAICNPCDDFDETIGIKKAVARAKANKDFALFATKKGYINTPMVKAFIEQEANYLKDNPSLYIKGYKEREEKYYHNLRMQELEASLSDFEKTAVEDFLKNPEHISKIADIVQWKRKSH